MAITPFFKPAEMPAIQLRDYTPVEMIGKFVDKLDAKNEAAMDAADKFSLAIDSAAQQVLDVQRPHADKIIGESRQMLADLAASGDLIDALPAIRRQALKFGREMATFNQNYKAVSERKSEMSKALADDPMAFTQEDYDYFIPTDNLATDPKAVFNAPLLTRRFDRHKLAMEAINAMEPDQDVQVRAANGSIYTVKRKDLSPDEIELVVGDLLRNTPAVQAELARDFSVYKKRLGEDPEGQFAWALWEAAEAKKAELDGQKELSDEERTTAKQKIDAQLEADMQNLPGKLYQQWEQQVGLNTSPYRRFGYSQKEEDIKTDQAYWKRVDLAADAAGGNSRNGRTQSSSGDDVSIGLNPSSGYQNDFSPLVAATPPGAASVFKSPEEAREFHGNQIRVLTEQREAMMQGLDALPPQEKAAKELAIRTLDLELDKSLLMQSVVEGLQEQAMRRAGITPEQRRQMEAMRTNVPVAPPGVDPTRLDEHRARLKAARAVIVPHGIPMSPYDEWRRTRPKAENAWVDSVRRHEEDYKRQFGEQEEKINDAYEEISEEKNLRDVPMVTLTSNEAQNFKRALSDAPGIRVFKGDLTKNDEVNIEDGMPSIKEVHRVSAATVAAPDGAPGYMVKITGDDDVNYTFFTTDLQWMRRYLAANQDVGEKINDQEVGWFLHHIGVGRQFSPVVGGQNITGNPNGRVERVDSQTFRIIIPGQSPSLISEEDLLTRMNAIRKTYLKTGRYEEDASSSQPAGSQ